MPVARCVAVWRRLRFWQAAAASCFYGRLPPRFGRAKTADSAGDMALASAPRPASLPQHLCLASHSGLLSRHFAGEHERRAFWRAGGSTDLWATGFSCLPTLLADGCSGGDLCWRWRATWLFFWACSGGAAAAAWRDDGRGLRLLSAGTLALLSAFAAHASPSRRRSICCTTPRRLYFAYAAA